MGRPSNQGAPRSSLGELAVTLAMHFLPRCARRAALCALHSGKAHRVYHRDKRPQEVGAVGRPTSLAVNKLLIRLGRTSITICACRRLRPTAVDLQKGSLCAFQAIYIGRVSALTARSPSGQGKACKAFVWWFDSIPRLHTPLLMSAYLSRVPRYDCSGLNHSLESADSPNERHKWPIPGCFWSMMMKLCASA